MTNVGYLTSNTNTAWPLDGDDPGLDRDAARMFADGSATLYRNEDGLRVCIGSIEPSVSSIRFSALKVGKDGKVASSVDFDVPLSDSVYSVAKSSWCFFVVENHHVREMAGRTFAGPYRMDPAACSIEPERVTSISLYNHDPGSSVDILTDAGITGDVKILAGYNTYVGDDLGMASYIPVRPGMDDVDGIVVAAGPGLGLGTVPCDEDCSNDIVPNRGSMRPDEDGNVVFESDQCYQISPDEHRVYQVLHKDASQAYIKNVHILLNGRCTACCQCDAFMEINNRLASQSKDVVASYNDLIDSAYTYNGQAEMFNERLKHLKPEELVARIVIMGQGYDHGDAHSQNMGLSSKPLSQQISGSIDRSQAVVSLKNMSAKDVEALVVAKMSPQKIVMANILEPNGAGSTWTRVNNRVIECDGVFVKDNIPVPAGSGVTIRLYGARGKTTTPSKECMVEGFVIFSWREEIECPEGGGGDFPDYSNDFSNDLYWHTAFDVDSNDSNDADYTAHFGDFLPEYNFVEPEVDLSLDSNDGDYSGGDDMPKILPDEDGKCWTTKSLRRDLTVRQET